MSTFLDFPNELIPMGASTLDVHNKWKTVLTAPGWQVKAEQVTTKPYTLDVIPPATEAIGNADAYEFLRIATNDTVVSWQPLKHWTRPFPQMMNIYNATAGAVNVTATVAGVAVSYQGVAGSTAEDNLIGLFYALKASANAAVQAYAWELQFPAPQNADDSIIYIVGTRAAYSATTETITGTNCTADVLGVPVAAGFDQQSAYGPNTSSLPIDLTNGFIYYLQICSRGLALGIRTNTAYSGAIHACYSDHAKALEAIPKDSPYCSPIELCVGYDDGASDCDAKGRAPSYWCLPLYTERTTNVGLSQWYGPGSFRRKRDTFQDAISITSGYANYGLGDTFPLYGSYLFNDNSSEGNNFQIHRVGRSGYLWGEGNATNRSFIVVPPMVFDDWYKFIGTAVDENLITVADTVKVANLTADLDIAGATITVDDLSVFQPAGSVVIGKEWITYTGKSATTGAGNLTGCVKGTWSTVARKHYIGEKVSQGLWFVKMNGSALFAGYTKPV